MEKLEEFKKLFWDAFHRPKLETERYLQLWGNLEPLNDKIAGPLYSIYSNGNCDYIFQDDDRFPEIKTPDDFLDYCTELVKDYHEGVISLIPENDLEKADKQILLYQTDTKMELANLAYEVLS